MFGLTKYNYLLLLNYLKIINLDKSIKNLALKIIT